MITDLTYDIHLGWLGLEVLKPNTEKWSVHVYTLMNHHLAPVRMGITKHIA